MLVLRGVGEELRGGGRSRSLRTEQTLTMVKVRSRFFGTSFLFLHSSSFDSLRSRCTLFFSFRFDSGLEEQIDDFVGFCVYSCNVIIGSIGLYPSGFLLYRLQNNHCVHVWWSLLFLRLRMCDSVFVTKYVVTAIKGTHSAILSVTSFPLNALPYSLILK